MTLRHGKSGAYEESGRHAASRMNSIAPGNFVDLLHPAAMAQRAADVHARGTSQARWGFAASAGIAALAGLLMLRGARGMTGTMEDLGIANWYMFCGFVCLGVAYVSLSVGLEGRRLQQLSVKLKQRAELQAQRAGPMPGTGKEQP